MDIGSCLFTAGFAGDHAIRAVFLMIGGRPMIFGIIVGMDHKVCVYLRSSFVFQRPLASGSHLFSVCLACGTGKLVSLGDDFFCDPVYMTVTCSVLLRLRVHGFIWELTSGYSFRIHHFLVRQRIHVSVSPRCYVEEFHTFSTCSGTSDPEVGHLLCSLWLSAGPRCLASWPVWTGNAVRQWHVHGWLCWFRVVFSLVFDRPTSCWQWHGFCRFAGYEEIALCSLRRRQARGVFTGAIAATVPAACLGRPFS